MQYCLPKDLIVFISGVPGAGKTTLSYELLKKHNEFRLIEETDIIREILRGYQMHLASIGIDVPNEIASHDVFLDYEAATHQCRVMKDSIVNIVQRQQRKDIPTIINGVHVIPEVLCDSLPSSSTMYINLFISSEEVLWARLRNRNPVKYKKEYVPLLYQTNIDLRNRTLQLATKYLNVISLNIGTNTVNELLTEIEDLFYRLYGVD